MSSPFAGIDHVGYVVSDLDQAIRFAIEVLGFELVPERAGTLGAADGDTMSRRFGVPDRATASFRFVRAGNAPVEFLAWEAPDRSTTPARNCDAGGRHLAVKVTDMPAALERIGAFPGVEIREPNERGYIYVKTPFGLEVQLIPATGAA
ncbi:MAG: VOC family protein [Thermomicrobiales bacterium]|nr:VOC family protein [Thermomicrobiales bacterium]